MPINLVLLFSTSFIFYLTGVSPALYGGDAGEFITSVHTLGLPHAPGYPTYNLFVRALSDLIPVANHAYRINLISALIASAAVLVFYFFLLPPEKSRRNRFFAFAGMTILATTPLFTEQARAAEVFGLNFLFIGGILLALRKGKLPLAYFLFGLGLGNHHTLLVVAPFLWANPRRLPGLLVFFILGLSVYLYLPIRAMHNPPVNFGDPQTWERFWAVVRRKEFGSLSLHPAAVPFRSLELIWQDALLFDQRLIHQIGWSGGILVMVGFVLGYRHLERRTAAFVGAYFILVGLGFELFSNLSPGSDIGQWRLERFMLLPLFGSIVLLVVALEYLPRWALLVALAAFGVERMVQWPAGTNLRDNFVFRDFAVSALRSVPPGGTVVIDRVLFDEPTSALLVTTQVEKKRPDIQFLYRPGTLFNTAYGEDVLQLPWDQRFERQKTVEQQILVKDQALLYGLAFEKKNLPINNPVLTGFLYSSPVQGEGRVGATEFLLMHRISPTPRHTALAGTFPQGGRRYMDYPRRLIAVHFPYFRGKAALEKGDRNLAESWFAQALAIGGHMVWLQTNIGGLWAQVGEIEKSRHLFEKATRLDPYFSPAFFGLGFTALKANDMDTARASYARAVKLDPTNKDAQYMLNVANTLNK